MKIPKYEIIENWDHNWKCVLKINNTLYKIKGFLNDDNEKRFLATTYDDKALFVLSKFTSIIRQLDRL